MAADEPQLRSWFQDPPDYGDNPDMFTIQLEHNGFFCGLMDYLEYVSGTCDFFDFCNVDTFSLIWIHEFVSTFGHPLDDKMHVYWCKPGRELKDGVMCIEKDSDIVEMIQAAAQHKTLSLLVDHTNFVKNLRGHMIINAEPEVNNEGSSSAARAGVHADVEPQVTIVISPNAVPEGSSSAARAGVHDYVEEQVQSEAEGVVTDADTDTEFYDSDWDAEEGDDDIFDSQVDKDVDDHNKPVLVQDLEDDTATEDESLKLTKDQEAYLKYKFTEFNPEVDMENPVFKVGMVFADANDLRRALAAYSIRNRVKVRKPRNEAVRINAVCEPGCTWMLKASKDSITEALVVREYEGKHTCETVWELQALTAPFLAQYFINEFKDNQKMSISTFAAKITREFNMTPNRWKLTRAREMALTQIYGDEAIQFNSLWDYGQELRTRNPGSKFFLSTTSSKAAGQLEAKEHLSTLYWSYDACKRGFLHGCRPFICIDGCHIKTRYKGILLTVVGVDPNDCIYPIAMGLVEVECSSSWEWFLTTLKDDLNITNTSPFTIMSDKQKGLINAVKKVFPDLEHRFCVRHLYQNFHKKHKGETLKNDLWAIARSTNVPTWQKNMDKMKNDSEAAYNWVEELPPNTWVKAFFSDFPKCDMLLNNHSEVFNSYIINEREMPMLSMLESIFLKIMNRMVTIEEEADKWTGTICPKIKKKLDKTTEFAANCGVKVAAADLFLVTSGEYEREYNVDLKARTCDCKRWQLSGIPCHHAIACCRTMRKNPETLVHSCYSIATYKMAYSYKLVPLRGRVYWEKQNGVKIHPPLYTKVMGRPKKNRKKAPEEKLKNGVNTLTRGGLTMHCSICKKPDHNKKGHYKYLQSQEGNENGGADVEQDIPEILNNIIPQNPNPNMDPEHQFDSMVYKMGQEELAHVAPTRTHGPLPSVSSFVAAARDTIPQARVTTAMARGRGSITARGRGRGRGRNNADTAQAHTESRGRGRGKGKKRNAEASSSDSPQVTARGRANRHVQLPDLNQDPAEEIQITQNAPNDAI